MAEHEGPAGEPIIVPSVDEICSWLAGSPNLGDVARETRRLRVLLRELDGVVQLLRQHVLAEIGEGMADARGTDEPF